MPENMSETTPPTSGSGVKPEKPVMDAEIATYKLEALKDLIKYEDFRGYASDMLKLAERSLAKGDVALAGELSREGFDAMGHHEQRQIAKALSGDSHLDTVQSSLTKLANNSGYGKS